MKLTYSLLAGAVVVAAASLPVAAWAGHVKPGLWEFKIQSNSGQMQSMPDMSKMPPQVRARLRAQGVQMNGGDTIVRQCITPTMANADKFEMGNSKNCRVENARYTGNTYTADMVCTGRMNSRGHVQITFESPLHYYGTTTVNGSIGDRKINTAMKIDAHFVIGDCGKIR